MQTESPQTVSLGQDQPFIVLNLVGSSKYVVEFNTDGLIIAYQNGIYSPIAYKYSVLEGKVVEWKC